MLCCFTSEKLRSCCLYAGGWTLIQSLVGAGFGIVWIANDEESRLLQVAVLTIGIFGALSSCLLLSAIFSNNSCALLPWLLHLALVLVLGCVVIIGSILATEFTTTAVVGVLLLTDVVCFTAVLMYYDSKCERSFRRFRRH